MAQYFVLTPPSGPAYTPHQIRTVLATEGKLQWTVKTTGIENCDDAGCLGAPAQLPLGRAHGRSQAAATMMTMTDDSGGDTNAGVAPGTQTAATPTTAGEVVKKTGTLNSRQGAIFASINPYNGLDSGLHVGLHDLRPPLVHTTRYRRPRELPRSEHRAAGLHALHGETARRGVPRQGAGEWPRGQGRRRESELRKRREADEDLQQLVVDAGLRPHRDPGRQDLQLRPQGSRCLVVQLHQRRQPARRLRSCPKRSRRTRPSWTGTSSAVADSSL